MRQEPITVGNQFKIKETGHVLLVINRNKEKDPMFTVKYYGDAKPALMLSESQIQRLISFGAWIKTKI